MHKVSIETTVSILNRLKEQDERRGPNDSLEEKVDNSQTNSLTEYIRSEIPLIRVLKLPDTHPLREHGEYITLDNRRLFCFHSIQLPNLKIPVVVLNYEEMETDMHQGKRHELWKLTTVNGGGLPVVRRGRGR